MPKTILPRRWWLILACAVILSGCSSLKILPTGMTLPGQEDKPQQPGTIVAMWSDMVLQQPDGQAVRGFGGRLTFYMAKGIKPVRVEGTLVVYGFEEEDGIPAKVQPDQKYVFTTEQFAQHYEKTSLGHSYAVWIPWDAAGGPNKDVSLIARFTPKNGQLVVGEQTRHVLPGPAAPESGQPKMARIGGRRSRDTGVRPVSYETQGPARRDDDSFSQPTGSRMQITTIEMTPELAAQMRSGEPIRWDRPAISPPSLPVPQAPTGLNSHQQTPSEAGLRRGAALTGSPETERPEARQVDPRSGYSRPGQLRVPAGPIARPSRDRGPTPPCLGGWPSALEPTPSGETAPGAGPASSRRPTVPDSSSPGFGAGPRS